MIADETAKSCDSATVAEEFSEERATPLVYSWFPMLTIFDDTFVIVRILA